jgi:hypothetical protein
MGSFKLYERYYDNPNRKPENYLGEFYNIHQLRDDCYVDDFIAVNAETNQVCVVLSTEFKGIGGGIGYEVFPLANCIYTGGFEE